MPVTAGEASESLTISPRAGDWRGLTRTGELSERALATREALGLPTDRPIIASGHQAGIWHAGIAAKWFALEASAEALGAGALWVVVDHDPGEPLAVRYPARDADGVLVERTVGAGSGAGVAPCALPAGAAWALPDDAATEVADGLRAMHDALSQAGERSRSAGEQAHRGAQALLAEATTEVRTVWSSRLALTTGFGDLIDAMMADADRAHETYNRALRSAAGAGLRELGARSGDVELPMWRLDDGRRVAVYASELGSIDRATLAPRALLMTLFLRRDVCDLFIHGLGGGATGGNVGYDRATEAWAQAWLGETLAPAVEVSATRFVDFAEEDRADRRDVAQALALAHRAAHNPGLVGDEDLQARKRERVAEIEAARQEERSPASAFRAMHEMLDDHRRAHAGELEELRRRATLLARRAAARDVALDRTWAFPLLGEGKTRRLREEIASAFASA